MDETVALGENFQSVVGLRGNGNECLQPNTRIASRCVIKGGDTLAAIDPSIFRQYDIRGIYGNELTEEDAYSIGRAYGTYVQRRDTETVIVGHDNRSSSPSLQRALIEGLVTTSCKVVSVGEAMTPVLYFACQHFGTPSGVMVTGSHNAPEYNGFKLCWGTGTLYGEEIEHLRVMIENDDFDLGEGTVCVQPVESVYSDWLRDHAKLNGPQLTVVVDCGNGTGSAFIPPILRRLGCKVIELYCESDSNFPNHHPDPTKLDCLYDLMEAVKKNGADVGVGFDGDCDRIGVVDECGEVLWGDYLMIIFVRDVLRRFPGSAVPVEVKCSQALWDEVVRAGGKPVWSPTGHSLIKAMMRELDSKVAGEMSGHMFFADEYFGYDDAVYACCRLLRILAGSVSPLSSLLSDVPRYASTPEIRLFCPDEIKFRIVSKIVCDLKKGAPCDSGVTGLVDVDGARVIFNDGWGLIRASNTQPALIVRAEASNELGLEGIKNYVSTVLSQFPDVSLDWSKQE